MPASTSCAGSSSPQAAGDHKGRPGTDRTVAGEGKAACHLSSAQNQPERIRNYFERELVLLGLVTPPGVQPLANFFRVELSHSAW